MLRDILCNAMTDEADLAVAGLLAEGEALLAGIERTRPDVVVLGVGEHHTHEEVTALLWACPRIKVVTVSANGRQAMIHGLRPHVDQLGEASPQDLLSVVRAAIAVAR